MTLQIPPGYAELALVFDLPDTAVTCEVTIGVEVETTPSQSQLTLLYTGGGWQDAWHAIAAAPWHANLFKATVGQDGGDPIIVEAPLDDTASTGSDPSSPQVAVLIKKRSGLGGKRHRGRFYWPGVDEDTVDSTGALDGAYVASVQTAVDDILSAVGTSAPFGDYVILHSAMLVGPNPPDVIESFVVESIVATQRRRLRR